MKKPENDTIQKKEFYLAYSPALIYYVRKFIEDFLVEDVVHDSFIRLWSKPLIGLSEIEKKKLLYIIARNLCIDILRKRILTQDILEMQEASLRLEELLNTELPDKLLIQKDRGEELEKAINELPEKCRLVIRMYYLESMKTSQIAERLSLSPRTVENHLYRAIQLLRKKSDRFVSLLLLLK